MPSLSTPYILVYKRQPPPPKKYQLFKNTNFINKQLRMSLHSSNTNKITYFTYITMLRLSKRF